MINRRLTSREQYKHMSQKLKNNQASFVIKITYQFAQYAWSTYIEQLTTIKFQKTTMSMIHDSISDRVNIKKKKWQKQTQASVRHGSTPKTSLQHRWNIEIHYEIHQGLFECNVSRHGNLPPQKWFIANAFERRCLLTSKQAVTIIYSILDFARCLNLWLL